MTLKFNGWRVRYRQIGDGVYDVLVAKEKVGEVRKHPARRSIVLGPITSTSWTFSAAPPIAAPYGEFRTREEATAALLRWVARGHGTAS